MSREMKLSIRKNRSEEKNGIRESKEATEELATENNSVNKMTTKENINNLRLSKMTEDEPEKELFTSSPIIALLLKIFFLIEGQIVRAMVQFGDLYFAAIITNIYLEIVIIIICSSAESNIMAQIYAFLSSLIFAYLMRNVCTIAYWELFQLKWFKLNPFESITNLFNPNIKKHVKKNIYYIVNIIFGILFYLFIIGTFTMPRNEGKFLDVVVFVIFVLIPFLKFVCYYCCYIFICFRDMFRHDKLNDIDDNCKDPFLFWLQLNNLTNKGKIKVGISNESIDFKYKNKKKKKNCCEKLFFKAISFHFSLCSKKIILHLQTLFKIIFAILSLSYFIYSFLKKSLSLSGLIFIISLYIISLIICIEFSTPMWIINSIYRWHLKIKKKYERKYQMKCRKLNEKFGYFKLIDMIPVILSIGLLFFIFFTNIFFRISSWYLFDNIRKIEEKGKFIEGNWTKEILSEQSNFENIICNSSIYGLNMLKIGSLALASYTSNIENTRNYIEKSFFKEKIEKINEMRILNENSKYGVVLLITVTIPHEKPLSIFAIQGSIKKLDWWLDIEIFCSSAIFSFLNRISVTQLESLTSNIITWLLTLPLRFLDKLTLFKKYFESLDPYISEEIKKINGTNNIIFIGHSLGGGLAKFFGLKYHKESVSFSGPGITPLEFKLKDELNYKYFKTNLIDVIPDYDTIPRIETSAGIRYRVLCNKGFFECHGIERTICQMGATCRREDLTGDLCMSLFGKEYYNIRKLAGIKNNMPEEYNKSKNSII
jgi:hypothetical protein